MSEVNTISSLSPFTSVWRTANKLLIATCLGLSHSSLMAAEQEWWFDVEVIVFKRDANLTELSEKFAHQAINTSRSQALDLLTPYIHPDLSYLRANLPFCQVSSRAEKQQKFERDFAFPTPVPKSVAISDGLYHEESTPNVPTTERQTHNTATNDDLLAQVFDALEQNKSDSQFTEPQQQSAVTYNNIDDEFNYVAQDTSVNWLEWQIPSQLPCVYADQLTLLANPLSKKQEPQPTAKAIDNVPIKINGIEWQNRRQAFLLPQSELNLRSLYTSINRQRDIQPMLYLGWRQEVKFGQNNAQALRLFAGQNYGTTYLTNGHLKQLPNKKDDETHTPHLPMGEHIALNEQMQANKADEALQIANAKLFADIHAALENDNKPLELDSFFISAKALNTNHNKLNQQPLSDSDIWQLDGELKVYLQNVGRTPYLHIDSTFDYRQPVFDPSLQSAATSQNSVVVSSLKTQANKLESINVQHFKRVISKQLHYFDHPLFGMVVYITRYHRPDEPTQTEELN